MGHSDTQLQIIEVKSNGVKDYYLEGFVSTTDPDLVNDIVTEKAQQSILNQLMNMKITVDDDHDSHRDKVTGKLYDRTQNKLPLALIVDAEMRKTKKGSLGTWVKAKLNKDYPLFKEYLNSIKNGFVHSFSIAYKVTKFTKELIDDTVYRIIDDLNIRNIGATGSPVNGDAQFDLALKSFPKMAEENKKIEELEASNTDLKSQVETLTSEKEALGKELSELKGMDYKKMYEEMKAKYDKMKESNGSKDSEMKSFNDKMSELEKSVTELQKENAELKSFVESPQLKSIVEGKSVDPQANNTQKVSAWDIMA